MPEPKPAAEVEAIVPVRGLPAGKTRLAAVLTVEQRNRLVRAMLHDVVRALQRARSVTRVTIFSRDAAAEREAERLGVNFLQQPTELRGLNAAIGYAQDRRRDTDALLIVPADLPLVTSLEIDDLIAAGQGVRAVAIAPAADGGTNGLLLRPPTIIEPAYGPQSAQVHEDAARRAGASLAIRRSDHWSLDLDTPEQLGRLIVLAQEHPDADELETLRCLRDAEFPDLSAWKVPPTSAP